MKLPCHVIEDLLPLYHDHVCSPESSTLVEDHLNECGNCTKLLHEMQEIQAPANQTIDDTAPLKAIGTVWKKSKKKSFIKGTVIAILACTILFGAYFGLTQWKCIPVSADRMEVTQVSRLSDGRIIYHLNIKDDKNLYFIKFTANPDGSYYMTPMRSLIEGKRSMENGLFNDYFTVDIAEKNAYQQKYGDNIVISSCYIGPVGDGILIWEEGMGLPPASAELEQMGNE